MDSPLLQPLDLDLEDMISENETILVYNNVKMAS